MNKPVVSRAAERRQAQIIDKKIEQSYYRQFAGRQIDVLKIGALFAQARKAISEGVDVDVAVKTAGDALVEVDVEVENHGSLFLFKAVSKAAKAWAQEHIGEDAQHFGGGIVVEPRYIADLVAGAQGDGLVVR